MAAGYGTNTGEMASAATSINKDAEEVKKLKQKVTSTEVTGSDFGHVNKGSWDAYNKGFNNAASWLEDHAKAMNAFASKLEDSRGGYEWAESTNAGDVSKSGEK
ncbi:MAG: hypothetical protein ACRDQA_25940 [Nocardioidaceae bacterium]